MSKQRFRIDRVQTGPDKDEEVWQVWWKPAGWFKKWQLVDTKENEADAERHIKIVADYPHITGREYYDHKGHQEYDAW